MYISYSQVVDIGQCILCAVNMISLVSSCSRLYAIDGIMLPYSPLSPPAYNTPPPCSQQPAGPGVRYPSGRVVDIPRKASLSASYKGGLTCTAMLHTKYYNNDLRGCSKCNIIRIISPPFLLLLSVKSRIIIFPSTRQLTPPSSSTRQLLDAHSLGSTWNS